jgi:phosphoribosyl-ATP pyrophosphohydrolase
VVAESADLIYHLLVRWADCGIEPDEVWQKLAAREGTSGLAEKASRPQT